MQTVQGWIERLGLEPIPGEGGWFRRLAEGPVGADGLVRWSSIVALFSSDAFSALHRLAVDEIWVHQAGDALEMLQLPERGFRGWRALGGASGAPQIFVPAGVWQGARPVGPLGWSLVSCICVPGFETAGFEPGSRRELSSLYPEFGEAIACLTRG